MSEINKAINNIMKDVGYVQKSSSKGLNYSYAGESALIKALRPVMVQHGVSIAPVDVSVVAERAIYVTAKGTNMNHAVVIVTYELSHVSGEYKRITVPGEGADTGDKAFSKAMTNAYKYALRQTFTIETGDEKSKFATDDGWSDEFVFYCSDNIARYKGNLHMTKNALRKLFENGPKTKEEAQHQFEKLKEHAEAYSKPDPNEDKSTEELQAELFGSDNDGAYAE